MRGPHFVDRLDSRVADTLVRMEAQIDYKPVKVALWGIATASILSAVAAGLGTVAAGAGAYIAVKTAIRITKERSNTTAGKEIEASEA